jgi:ABC-2 type transport system ATP-binding protein
MQAAFQVIVNMPVPRSRKMRMKLSLVADASGSSIRSLQIASLAALACERYVHLQQMMHRLGSGEAAVIHVSKLTKFYGDYKAIEDVTFEVARGQVVGFLGPNGAGKTTTMRILSGFLTATSGSATIDGLDVFWKPLEVRRKIGYLPESCPLYPEMRVTEYLRFRAGIKGLHGHAASKRIEYVLGRCWLTDVHRQLIGTLSKGYRQRVGLADTLLHDPSVLILDEPTAGLDPNQQRETRNLIRELGQQHTILHSTHILTEVERTCERIIIIDRGRVAAMGDLSELQREHGNLEDFFSRLTEGEEVARR